MYGAVEVPEELLGIEMGAVFRHHELIAAGEPAHYQRLTLSVFAEMVFRSPRRTFAQACPV